ncbi:tetratricopeptide repeat protein [Thermomonospora umbrina]|uniref:Tetratricopeptide repeat protein n=1 Tax=Thermomonospora umbrina TaxID=111806 RepID=A0A3D9SWU2_9ACTN|nr:hypothetical protein [Thermomonospora umbrina]REF00420.1 hypothetical protein DFJ69_5955 [Thermomonospora umbrina]
MADSRIPNHLLRALLDEVGWSGAELARHAGAVAAEQGVALSFDRKTVSFWLAGRRPRPPAPAIVAEAFSRALGRPVTIADTGLARDRSSFRSQGAPATAGPHAQPAGPRDEGIGATDPAAALRELGQKQRRRRVPTENAYRLALLNVPTWTRAASAQTTSVSPAHHAETVTAPQVETIEQMVRLFIDNDGAFGGGYARGPLSAYLAHDVAPLLGGAASPQLRLRMFRAATQLTYLCAFMCFDDEEHAIAQRYHRTALDLAIEAADPAGYAVILRAMSVQARSLGHHHEALVLAETAAATGRRKASPARHAFLLGQVAVAAAADSDRATALSALSAAERRLEQATSQTRPCPTRPSQTTAGSTSEVIGDYHPAALAHQEAAVRALLGDTKGAITALQTSLRHRPGDERRSRAITTARLAELHLRLGHLDQAVHTWHLFLDDYPHLSSARVTSALQNMKAQLRPHSGNAGARHLLARTATL